MRTAIGAISSCRGSGDCGPIRAMSAVVNILLDVRTGPALLSLAGVLAGCNSSVTISKAQSPSIQVDRESIHVPKAVNKATEPGHFGGSWEAGVGRHFVVVAAKVTPGKYMAEPLDAVLSGEFRAKSVTLVYDENTPKDFEFSETGMVTFSMDDGQPHQSLSVVVQDHEATFRLHTTRSRNLQFLFEVPDGRRAFELEIRPARAAAAAPSAAETTWGGKTGGDAADPFDALPPNIRSNVRNTSKKFVGTVRRIDRIALADAKTPVLRGVISSLMGLHSPGQKNDRTQLQARVSVDGKYLVVADEKAVYAAFLGSGTSHDSHAVGKLPLFFKDSGDLTFGVLKEAYPARLSARIAERSAPR